MSSAFNAGLSVDSVNKPSIFELIACQSLDSTFHPAFQRVVTYVVSKSPEKCGFLLQYYDEIFLGLSAFVQSHYLRRHGGSLSEVFYGLTRFHLKTETFTKRDFVVSMIFLVGIPYFTRKLDKKMKKIKEKLDDELTSNDKNQIFQLYTYRICKVTFAIVQIVRYVSYLSGRSPNHSIQLMMSNIGLKYAKPQDHMYSWKEIFQGKMKLTTVLSSLMLRSLEFGGFFLQFIQWWNDNSTTAQAITKMTIPDPPPPDPEANRYFNLCPLCLQEFKIPTILRISGYVFCYKCITKHLKKHEFCPVTTYPATADDLVRIYDN